HCGHELPFDCYSSPVQLQLYGLEKPSCVLPHVLGQFIPQFAQVDGYKKNLLFQPMSFLFDLNPASFYYYLVNYTACVYCYHQ
ncbi:MAG: hypothetical protein EZS28_042197, partial [Streblomastix strix]